MAAIGASVALVGDASLAITAEPAPVEQISYPWWEWWYVATMHPPSVKGGLLASHASFGSAALTESLYSASDDSNHFMGAAALTAGPVLASDGRGDYVDSAVLAVSVPVLPGETPNELTYFTVSGYWYDVESPDMSGSTNQALWQIISGYVTLYPRVPQGFTLQLQNLDLQDGSGVGADVGVSLAPIQCRIMHGRLSTINRDDSEAVRIVAGSSLVSDALAAQLDPKWAADHFLARGQLVYDVRFTKVVFAAAAQTVANFGFVAPSVDTEVCLTDPGIARLSYGGPTK